MNVKIGQIAAQIIFIDYIFLLRNNFEFSQLYLKKVEKHRSQWEKRYVKFEQDASLT